MLLVFAQSCNFKRVINDDYASYDCFLIYGIDDRVQINLDSIEKGILLERYSESSLIIANAYGLIPDLKRLEEINSHIQKHGINDTLLLSLIQVENRIDETLDLAYLELATVEDNIDCSIIKLKKIRDEVRNENDRF